MRARIDTGAGGGTEARRSLLRREDGQSLVETGIVMALLITLSIGLVEFGRAWMVANMITHAARDGARAAALTPSGNRDGSCDIIDTSAIASLVRSQIAGVLPTSEANAMGVAVTHGTAGGLPTVTVTVTGSVNYIFNMFGSSFAINRSVTFSDEGGC